MYDLEFVNQKLNVSIRGDRVIEGLVPSVKLDDGTVVGLSLSTHDREAGEDRLGAYDLYRFVYEDEAATLRVTLNFRAYGDVMVASASVVSLKGPQIGVRARGLAAFEGLRLAVGGLGDVAGLMANYLHKDWWTRPHFDPDPAQLPPRTQSILWKAAGRYHHLLCVADNVFKTEAAGDGEGLNLLTAAYDGGYNNVETVIFTLAGGTEPFELPERNVSAGMQVLGTPFQARKDKRYPMPFEYLGWCSWDAFYREVSAEGILAKAQEFLDKELPVRWFIVDDGWMRHIDTHLTGFEPDPEKFPEGFGALSDALKTDYGVWWLGVWHTLFGYWNGIHPESDLTAEMGDALHTTHTGKVIPAPEVGRALGFWDAWHRRLRNAGIDFVKVDYQSGLVTFYQQELAIGTAALRAHQALEASVGKNFDNVMINCMGMATENLWHRPMSAVTRNSDDFFPKREESFVEHALQNAYNAYYHAPFMWLDWDMWWTRHPHAATHAVLRAVSGGPVYISDKVGETDAAQLRPLVLSDGRLLRCDDPGMATEDCLLHDPSREPVPLKVWNRVGETGVVGAFNVHLGRETVSGTVSPADVPGLLGERFVVYEYFGRTAQVVGGEDQIPVALEPDAAALYVIVPLTKPHTPIGLVDKYIAPAAVADWFTAGERLTVVMLEGGRFAWAAERAPREVRVNGEIVDVATGDGFYYVDCEGGEGAVWIEIV